MPPCGWETDALARRATGTFDRILVDAAITALPWPLISQLAPDGRIVAVERMEEGSFLVRYGRTEAGTLRRETFGRFALPLADERRLRRPLAPSAGLPARSFFSRRRSKNSAPDTTTW